MTATAARDLLAHRRCVLLDFDGPICSVFGSTSDRRIAEQLAAVLADTGVHLPAAVARTNDPFAVLRFAASAGPSVARRVEADFRRLETEAVATAPQTTGAADAIRSLSEQKRLIAIVSNNSHQAVRSYLAANRLRDYIGAMSARSGSDISQLKPNPHLIDAAIQTLGCVPDACVMVGDSPSDIEAARRAGVAVIAFANKPGKRQRLAAHNPDAIIASMADLVGQHVRRSLPS